jgi:hypothetical protein
MRKVAHTVGYHWSHLLCPMCYGLTGGNSNTDGTKQYRDGDREAAKTLGDEWCSCDPDPTPEESIPITEAAANPALHCEFFERYGVDLMINNHP